MDSYKETQLLADVNQLKIDMAQKAATEVLLIGVLKCISPKKPDGLESAIDSLRLHPMNSGLKREAKELIPVYFP